MPFAGARSSIPLGQRDSIWAHVCVLHLVDILTFCVLQKAFLYCNFVVEIAHGISRYG